VVEQAVEMLTHLKETVYLVDLVVVDQMLEHHVVYVE
tara:strand:+ start:86 stop:196 length:111 start_codon:yes stop_codon:yes gene_type:complete